MTIAQMATYFDILQDKYGSPYFINSEKTLLLNRAQVIFVKELLPTEPGEVINLEATQNTIMEITPLLVPLPSMNVPSTGIITYTILQTALTGVINGAEFWRVISIGYSNDGVSFRPVKYVRHNDWYAFADNYFKFPDDTNPKVKESYNGFTILPVNANAFLYIDVLKYPREMDIDMSVSTDLPDFTHDKIVSIALELAGIGTRDQMLNALVEAREHDKG
jgi:hypothetical protein